MLRVCGKSSPGRDLNENISNAFGVKAPTSCGGGGGVFNCNLP